MNDRLTLILTIKDRPAFTQRWMRYMNDRRCPYPVLIADGGTDTALEAHLRHTDNYPALRYTYVRYPIDTDYATYHAKLADITARVSTPYVQLADDDDFVLFEANDGFCRFLDAHPGTVSCGGSRYVLRLLSGTGTVMGMPQAARYEARLDARARGVTGATAAERLTAFFTSVTRQYLWDAWYWVHRAPALAAAFDKGRRHRFRDPVTHEAHVHMMLLSVGEYHDSQVPGTVIQAGSSQLTAVLEREGSVSARLARVNGRDDLLASVADVPGPLSAGERQGVIGAIDSWLAQTAARAVASPPPFWQRWLGVRPAPKPTTTLPVLEPYILG